MAWNGHSRGALRAGLFSGDVGRDLFDLTHQVRMMGRYLWSGAFPNIVAR